MRAAPEMDAEFVSAFESLELPASAFGHEEHVRLGFLYLQRWEFVEALPRFVRALRRFAAAHGVAAKYHETITVAFLALINQRMEEGGRDRDWPTFRYEHPELFDKNLLDRFYAEGVIASPLARRAFVLGGGPVP